MTTIIIYDQCGQERIEFLVVKKDVSHLNGVYINSSDASDEQCDELNNLIYTKAGKRKIKPLYEFPIQEATEGPSKVIVCGFLP